MRREIIFAIILGIILGGVILYGLRLANNATKNLDSNPAVSPTPAETAQITSAPSNNQSPIVISSPQDNSVSITDKIILSGVGPANSELALLTEKSEDFIKTDDQGRFSLEIPLVGGENEITVSALIDDQIKSTTITIIYTSAKINL